ncbi:MAG: CDP-diacylglycerol--glycerol-3-phosphate 3-phosphatidyltransferase [Proteobacteria bacterium]|nr:CDP-diacylglycerol--glycerol-3-phosphate 3-phosphatidyltransferase [Pseudomonadota bacterium]
MQNFVLFLTLLRIFSGPLIFILVIYFEAVFIALFVFLLASITDYLDGKLARRYNVESSLGATLDPIADKILILFAFITIILITGDNFIAGMMVIIIAREFWVSALREYSAKQIISQVTAVSFLAKIKTTLQFITILLFYLGIGLDIAMLVFIASFFLFLALLVSIKTGLEYTVAVFGNKTL